MTQWSRTIARRLTNALPAWRAAMTNTNTVYYTGDAPSAVLPAKIVWPTTWPVPRYAGLDGIQVLFSDRWGSSVYLSDVGNYGKMVLGYTGEDTFADQLIEFTMSDDNPTWNMFQQPVYATSLAQAQAINADWYLNPTDAASVPGARTIASRDFPGTWDGVFPVATGLGWVMWRKAQTSYLGNNRPWFFRYGMPNYVPANATGTGAGALIVNPRGTIHGPFQGSTPGNVGTLSNWYADVWPDGSPKDYLYAMNVATKQWTRLDPPIPQRNRGAGDGFHPYSAWDPATKRLYFSIHDADNAYYWADFTNGIAGMTWGGPVVFGLPGGGDLGVLGDDGNSCLCVPVSGPNAGRRLWFFKHNRGDGNPWLGMMDLTNNNFWRLNITGLPSTGDEWNITYDQANNIVFITTKGATFVRLYKLPIPTDPTNPANWSLSLTTCTFASGVTLDSGFERTRQLGQRGTYVPALGTILMTQINGRTVAIRPA